MLIGKVWISPKCMGILSAQQAKGRKAFSFSYNAEWINSQEQLLIDPDIAWYSGRQFPDAKENFGVFLDSMPDNLGQDTNETESSLKCKRTKLTCTKIIRY